MFSELDNQMMQQAILLAKKAADINEVPVGAVLVSNGKIIAEGWNCSIQYSDPTAHAEIMALRAGGLSLNNYRLLNTELYVTLEPCVMCVGALVHARVKRVVFGAYDPKSGAVTSTLSLPENFSFNHRINYEGGLMAESCGGILSNFFKNRRL